MRKKAMPTARGRCSRFGLVPLMLFSSLGTWGFSPSKSSVERWRQTGKGWAARRGGHTAAAAAAAGGERGTWPPTVVGGMGVPGGSHAR